VINVITVISFNSARTIALHWVVLPSVLTWC